MISTAPQYEAIPRRAWLVLAVVSAGSVMNPLSTSILNIAFTRLRVAFPETSPATLSWVVSIYSITSAATLVVGGVIADRYGRKKMLIVGAAGFSAASLACGFAPNVGFLLVARVVQAIFGSLTTPAGAALVLREFPATRRTTAISAWAASGSVATAFGPTVGALLVDWGGWAWAFWITVPFGILSMLTVPWLVNEMKSDLKPAFPDLVSMPIIMMAVSGIILGISQSTRWGWGDQKTIASIAGGALLGVYLVVRSSRHERPMLDLTLFRYRSLRIANIASLTFGTAFFAMFFGFPQFTQNVWGYDVRTSGLLLMPIPLMGIFLNGPAGKFAETRGYRPVMMLGGAFQLIGALIAVFMVTGERDPRLWFVAVCFVGLAASLCWPAIFGTNVMSVPASTFGAVTAINQTAQRTATAAGVAIAVTLVGESIRAGSVGTYERIFVLTAIGGVLAIVVGASMSGRGDAPARRVESSANDRRTA